MCYVEGATVGGQKKAPELELQVTEPHDMDTGNRILIF